MHVVTRRYSGPGAKELVDLVLQHKDEIEKLMRGAPGFVSYIIAKTDNEWFTGTICVDKAGCDRSVEIARDWIARNAASTGAAATAALHAREDDAQRSLAPESVCLVVHRATLFAMRKARTAAANEANSARSLAVAPDDDRAVVAFHVLGFTAAVGGRIDGRRLRIGQRVRRCVCQ